MIKNTFTKEDTHKNNSKQSNFDEEETVIPNSGYNNSDEEETVIPGSRHINFSEEKTVIPGTDSNLVKNDSKSSLKYKKFNEATNTNITTRIPFDNQEEEETFILPDTNGTNTVPAFDIKEKNIKNNSILSKIKKYKNIIITLIGIGIFLVLLIVTLQTYNANKKKLLKIELKKREINLKNKIEDLYFLGINEYKLQKWDSANKYFLKVLEIKPDYQKAINYQKNSVKEKKNQISLETAEKYLKKKDYESLFKKLSEINKNSYYHEKAVEMKEKGIKQKEKEEKEAELLRKEAEEKNKAEAVSDNQEKAVVKVPERKVRRAKKARRVKKKRHIVKKVSSQNIEKAKSLYLSAYQKERQYPEKAKRNYRTIMRLLPSSESLYKKAKKRLNKLK